MSKYILENVSFKINANEVVAIVGVNGSGKTTIFVSHNLSSLKICDKMIYLENGKIEVGNHELLLNNNKSYSELYYSQADRFSYN